MMLAVKLSLYIIRYFIFSFFTVFSVFAVLILMVDLVELLRQSSSKNIPIHILFEMVLLKVPFLLQVIMPFVMLIASVLAYSSMARKSELVVIRAAGVSVWEFLLPSVVIAFFIGVSVVSLINPVSAFMYNSYDRLGKKYFEQKQRNTLEISESGLWLRQVQKDIMLPPDPGLANSGQEREEYNDEYEIVIHAEKVENISNKLTIVNVTVFAFTPNDKFYYRIDAPAASLMGKFWRFENARIQYNDNRIEQVGYIDIPTVVEYGDIQKSFSEPEAISFWKLGDFVDKLQRSGFSYLEYLLHWHKILSAPFFYAAMVMIGAIFCLKSARHLKLGYAVSMAILIGFTIYFISNLISSLGLSGTLPVFVAAWSTVIITLLVGIGLVLHYEDG